MALVHGAKDRSVGGDGRRGSRVMWDQLVRFIRSIAGAP